MALDADGREDFPSGSLRRGSISRKALKCKYTDFISNKIRILTFNTGSSHQKAKMRNGHVAGNGLK